MDIQLSLYWVNA